MADHTLSIRKFPDDKSHDHQIIIGQIPANQTCVVSFNQKSGQWVKITYKGVQGWGNLRYLRRQDQGCGKYYLLVNARRHVNLRQVPMYQDEYGNKTQKVGKIPATEQNCLFGLERVTKEERQWVMLQYEGVNGWVDARFLRYIDTDEYKDYCER